MMTLSTNVSITFLFKSSFFCSNFSAKSFKYAFISFRDIASVLFNKFNSSYLIKIIKNRRGEFAVILVGYPCFITVIEISFILSGIFAKAND